MSLQPNSHFSSRFIGNRRQLLSWSYLSAIISPLLFAALTVDVTAQEAEPPEQLQYLEGAASSVLSVEYGVGGKTIIGASANGNVFFWDSKDNKLIARLAGSPGPILSAATSPNGFQLATGDRDGVVNVFDIPTAAPQATIPGFAGLPTAVAVSPDGSLMLTGDQSKAVRLWNRDNNQNLRNFTASDIVTDIAMDTVRRSVFAIAIDGSLQGWNLDGGQDLGRIVTVPSNAASLHPDGHTIALAGEDGVLRIAQWPPQPMRNVVQHSGAVVNTAISSDKKIMVTGSHDQSVRLLDAETGAAIHTLAGHVGQAISTAISADASLVAAGNNTGIIKFWQSEDGADRGTLSGHLGAIRSLAFHPTLPSVASAGEDGTLRIWNIPKPSLSLTGHANPMTSARISHDGKSAATVSADQTLRLWNLIDGKQTWTTAALGQPLNRVAFAPNDKQLATGDAVGNVRLHNATDGAVESTRGAHGAAVTGIAYDAEAKRLVTSGLDGLVKLWNLPLIPPHTFPEYANGASSLSFIDDKQLAVADPDGTIHIGAKAIKIGEAITAGQSFGTKLPPAAVTSGPQAG